MIARKEDMKTEKREKMRGGSGEIIITHLLDKSDMEHCRLLAEIILPAGSSIGEHDHQAETEYFIILSGHGLAVDNGSENTVNPGDVVATGNGGSHSISNPGPGPLKMIAAIITKAEKN